MSDELEQRTRIEFDMLGNALQVWQPDHGPFITSLLSFEYNEFSQATQATEGEEKGSGRSGLISDI